MKYFLWSFSPLADSRRVVISLWLKTFHFSHYKAMEPLSCHNNESTHAMATKHINLIEAKVLKIS